MSTPHGSADRHPRDGAAFPSLVDELEKLAALVDRGWLTQAEFAEQKARLLHASGNASAGLAALQDRVARLEGRVDAVIAGGDARGAARSEPTRDGESGLPWLSRRGTIRL